MLKSIPRYQNYYYTSSGQKKVYGLAAEGVSPAIDIIDQDGEPLKLTDFFKIGDDIYFSISETDTSDPENITTSDVFYKQDKNDAINKISTLPTPELSRIQFSNPEFTIKDFDYQGTPCSDVNNETIESTGFERFLLVNGVSYFPGSGLYFNVAEGRKDSKHVIRKEGLYYWPVSSGRCVLIRLPEGEIW